MLWRSALCCYFTKRRVTQTQRNVFATMHAAPIGTTDDTSHRGVKKNCYDAPQNTDIVYTFPCLCLCLCVCLYISFCSFYFHFVFAFAFCSVEDGKWRDRREKNESNSVVQEAWLLLADARWGKWIRFASILCGSAVREAQHKHSRTRVYTNTNTEKKAQRGNCIVCSS